MASSDTTFRILVGIAVVTSIATGFTSCDSLISHRPRHQSSSSSVAAPRRATVYYPDDDGGGEGHHDDDATQDDVIYGFGPAHSLGYGPVSAHSIDDPLFGQLAGHLSSDPATTSTLARLASAFSPPGFAIDLANVNNVRCLSLDNRHIEIEAVVCDDVECSSLLVPVDFPEACELNDDDTALQDCILRNVHNLDVTGEHVLRERERVFDEEREAHRAMDALQSLDSEYLRSAASTNSLPYWWAPPASADDVSECDLIQQLLNGDEFQDMLKDLATSVLLFSHELGEDGVVRSARITAVGPEGIVLKVQVSLNGRTYDDEGGSNNEAVIDKPIRFSEMLPSNGETRGIREQVLMIVSSVNAA